METTGALRALISDMACTYMSPIIVWIQRDISAQRNAGYPAREHLANSRQGYFWMLFASHCLGIGTVIVTEVRRTVSPPMCPLGETQVAGRKCSFLAGHPGLADRLRAGFQVLVLAVKQLFPNFEFMWLVDEAKKNLPLELDFLNEGRNAEKVANMLKHFDFLKVGGRGSRNECGDGIESCPGYPRLEGRSWNISAKVSYVGDW